MLILIDQDIKGDSTLLQETLTAGGWPEVLPIRFVIFEEVSLPNYSDDRYRHKSHLHSVNVKD